MEVEQGWFQNYNRATYVDLGVGATEEDLAYTSRCAQWLGWTFDRQHGDPSLLQALLGGAWDDARFVVLEPGQTIRLIPDDRVIEAIDADASEYAPPRDSNPAPRKAPDGGPPAT